MKLTCHRPALAAAFAAVGPVVPSRTTKDVLKNVHLTALAPEGDAGGRAVLSGTDGEVGIRFTLEGVEVERPGSVLLPAQRVQQILRELSDEQVRLELAPAPDAAVGPDAEGGNEAIWIRAGHSEFRLAPEDPADFPPVPDFSEADGGAGGRFSLPAGVLHAAIKRTVFATDTESTRYALGGVLLEPGDSSLTFAATDSRRLAVVEAPVEAEGDVEIPDPGPVVPSKAMGLIERVLGDDEESVQLAVRSNDVLCRVGNAVVSARLVEGRFPKYKQVVPAESKITVTTVTAPFYSAVRQAQIVTSDESRGVDFTFHDGTLTLKSSAADVGASTIELPVDYTGESFTITFDPRFVADFLKVLDPEATFTIGLNDPDSAAVFRTGDDYTYVIMPLSRDR